MPDAGLGFTAHFHSSAHSWNKCLYHLPSGAWARSVPSLKGQRHCQAAAQSPPWFMLKPPQEWEDGMGWDGRAVPLHFSSRSHPFIRPAGAGQEGPPEPPWPKKNNPINEKPGGGQPPSWAMAALEPGLQGSTASSTGPSCGSNPLLPAPLTKTTPVAVPMQATKSDIWS